MVAVGLHQVGNILVGPFVEEAGIAVLALGVQPHVEALGHHHHAQRVAHVHLQLARHVVRRADGVAAHVLQDLDLADNRSLVHRSTQGAEIVVQADTLQLARHAVQLESLFLRHANGADTDLYRLLVNVLAVFHNTDGKRI